MTTPFPNLDLLLAQSDWVRGLARRLVSDTHAADDAVQSTWLAVLRHPLQQSESVEAMRAWLATTLRRNVIRNQVETARRGERESAAAHEERLPSTVDVMEQESVRRALVEAVLALDEPYRTALILRYFDGLTPSDIGQRLNLSSSTVRTRLQRGLALLRERFERERGVDWKSWCMIVLPLAKTTAAVGSGMTGGVLVGSKLKLAGILVFVLGASVVAWRAMDFTPTARVMSSPESTVTKLETPPLSPAPSLNTSVADATKTRAIATSENASARADKSQLAEPTPVDPVGILVYGSIVDEKGAPIAVRRLAPPGRLSMSVRFIEEHGDDVWGQVNANGAYSQAGLHPGHWRVAVWAEGYRQTSTDLELGADQPIRRFDLVAHHAVLLPIKIVTPEGRELMEVLKSEHEFDNYNGILVVATKSAPGASLPDIKLEGNAEAESSLWFGWGASLGPSPIPVPDSYAGVLEVLDDLPVFVTLAHGTHVLDTKLAAPGTEEIVFTVPLEKARSSVGQARVHVIDASTGEPFGAQASVYEEGNYIGGKATDKEGMAEFSGLRPGLRALQIWAPDHETLHKTVRILPGELTDLGTYRLESAASIEGEVIDENGQPISAAVHISEFGEPDEWYRWNAWSSKSSGSFEVKNLGHKRYWIWAGTHEEESLSLSPARIVDTRVGPVRGVVLQVSKSTALLVRFKSAVPWGSDLVLVSAEGAPVGYGWLRDGNKMRSYAQLRAVPGEYELQIVLEGKVVRSQHVSLSGSKVEIDL